MKVRIEMVVEISKEDAKASEIESQLKDVISSYDSEGSEIEFLSCHVESCRIELKAFPEGIRQVRCIESFVAANTNSIGGEIVKKGRCFLKGVCYQTTSWRPEGMMVDGFFVFHWDASKFELV